MLHAAFALIFPERIGVILLLYERGVFKENKIKKGQIRVCFLPNIYPSEGFPLFFIFIFSVWGNIIFNIRHYNIWVPSTVPLVEVQVEFWKIWIWYHIRTHSQNRLQQ